MSGSVFELALIVILVLLNGIFSATEIALVTLRRSRIQQLVDEGNKTAVRVQHLKANPGRFLAVIQIGINFLGFLASAFAAVSLVDDFAAWRRGLRTARERGERHRPGGRHDPADPVHDRLRRARAQTDRPGPRGARGDVDGAAHGVPRGPVRAARLGAHVDHAADQPAVRGRCRRRRADQLRGAAPDHRAGRRAGHPRGRRGADDPRGHRARRAAHPRGDGAAHRDGHPHDVGDDGRGARHDHRAGPQPDPGLRGHDRRDRRHPLRQGPAAVPEAGRARRRRRCARCCGRRCSCPSR